MRTSNVHAPLCKSILKVSLSRSPITVLKILLSFTTMVGVTLVARPPFIFGGENDSTDAADKRDYYVGVALSVVCGASGSLMYVLAARCRKCPKSLLMVSSGLWTLLIAFLCPAVGITNRVFTGGMMNRN